jgi:uroporphyrinogen decarboxylase
MPYNTPLQNDLLLRAARRMPVERTPVWFMRQAGRYLPEYRAIRAKADFLTLCKTPELASEVTIQPVDIVGVDAAIIFSDILVIPEAMGMELIVEEGKGGPRFPSPLRNASDIQRLKDGTLHELQFVFDALALTKKNLRSRVPLIGFSGAPWTLATYAIEGGGSKDFKTIKELMYRDPAMLHLLLGKFAKNVAEYLCAQVRAGADIVQIFDTWAGALAKKDFLEFGLRYIREIVQHVKANTNVPVIVFAKGANSSLREIAATGCDAVSVDWTVDIGEVKEMIGAQVALQGNLDPAALYAPPEKIREEVHTILRTMKGAHHIFNLGHGISPDVPVEHAKAMVQAVKEFAH